MTNVDTAPARRRGRPLSWTPDNDAVIRRMASSGYSDVEIARHLGRLADVVSRRRRELGLPRNTGMRAAICRMNLRRMLVAT